MDLQTFCVKLHDLPLTHAQRALSILWFVDNAQQGITRDSGELSRLMREAGLGEPHSTKLRDAMIASGFVLKVGATKLRLKPTSRATIKKWIEPVLEFEPPKVNQAAGFLPEAVWKGTRGYIEKLAQQVNGCYEYGFYDGASVLVRRLTETLLIEAYEHLNLDGQIRRPDGNYPMLSDIILAAVDKGQLSLGRESKTALKEIKTVGDRAAHNRRYTAVKADLDKIHLGVRLVVDELLHMSGMK